MLCTHVLGVQQGLQGLPIPFLDPTNLSSESHNSSSELYCVNCEIYVNVYVFLNSHVNSMRVQEVVQCYSLESNLCHLAPQVKAGQMMGVHEGAVETSSLQPRAPRLDVGFPATRPCVASCV